MDDRMPQYIKLSEIIYRNVEQNKDFRGDIINDLNMLMIELRAEIKKTRLKLLVNCIDFNELMVNPLYANELKLDLSIVPKSSNKEEFILWLATFIQKITVDEDQPKTPKGKKIKVPLMSLEPLDIAAPPQISSDKELERYQAAQIAD
ncbi:hypothetical protein [Acinetobacter indicus]|uniref:hypothetical protein n=3 Tax=Acinetobacter indicus TaxID=756892 RepID=UPI002019DB70|nr:hypothetical protein [Acinetobacter indicus]MCO8089140.1 hypothetical protein [Acinetobacter indicus]